MDRGLVTTLVSDLTLIVMSCYTGATISQDIYVGAGVAGIGIILAILDAKYPEEMDTVKAILEGVVKAEEGE